MKPTWELLPIDTKDSHNCKCLICGKEFTFLGEGRFNMGLIKCPTCNQEVWVPRCPNGCPSFYNEVETPFQDSQLMDKPDHAYLGKKGWAKKDE